MEKAAIFNIWLGLEYVWQVNRFNIIKQHQRSRKIISDSTLIWLLVWNIWIIFAYIGSVIIPIDTYFSEG